ncbi:hypothetical protein QC764_0064090 [Podospora pseudoanserina]|uniref:Uncharacterized protein n=1 Tax=Podospora pseudoanserina TaxID=2609844 RepID=A0ABR0I9G1_9PEZI|nr:hypothetical protein QC764_0064090 [Podospora pseudoanserina]
MYSQRLLMTHPHPLYLSALQATAHTIKRLLESRQWRARGNARSSDHGVFTDVNQVPFAPGEWRMENVTTGEVKAESVSDPAVA